MRAQGTVGESWGNAPVELLRDLPEPACPRLLGPRTPSQCLQLPPSLDGRMDGRMDGRALSSALCWRQVLRALVLWRLVHYLGNGVSVLATARPSLSHSLPPPSCHRSPGP